MQVVNVTRPEMLELLRTEKVRVRHNFASPEEYFFMKDEIIYDHEGHNFGTEHDEFIRIRGKEDFWQTDWLVWLIDPPIGNGEDLVMEFKNYYDEAKNVYVDDDYIHTNQAKTGKVARLKGATKQFKGGTIIAHKPRNLIGRNDPCPCGCGKKSKHCKNGNG